MAAHAVSDDRRLLEVGQDEAVPVVLALHADVRSPEKRTLMFRIEKEEDMQAQHITGGLGRHGKAMPRRFWRRSGPVASFAGRGSVRLPQRRGRGC